MDALALVAIAGIALLVAYFTYGRWLSRRVFQLDPDAETPATTERDGRDYVPTRKSIIFGHHFTSIAGTGPIVGPAIAVMWGWLPAILWVVFGAIFVGAVHDLGSIVVSLRKKGRSIGDIAGDLLGPRARLIFLCILIVGLWIVLAVFGLVIAVVLKQYPAAIFPVLVQIPLALIIGVLIHRKGRSIVIPSFLALGLMYASVIWGDAGLLGEFNAQMASQPIWMWTAFLLGYAYAASVLPVWLLLQPRDYINALQLITALGLITTGLLAAAILGGPSLGSASPDRPPLEIVAPMINWTPVGAPPLLPVLFITIACGACSGFHCLVGSGTTSKQIAKETDARVVGYGSMLTEGFLATLVIAACVGGIGLGAASQLNTNPGLITPGPEQLDSLKAGEPVDWGVVPYSQKIPTRPGVDKRTFIVESDGFQIDEFATVKIEETFIERDASGARSQLRTEFHTAPIGEWIWLEDGRVAVISPDRYAMSGPIAFAKQYESWSAAGSLGKKVGAFVEGAANFVASLGIARDVAIALMAVMVASFAATTMDTACRLQRYVIQELSRTFLPRRGRHECAGCGYDLSGHASNPSITCPECGAEHPAHEVYHHDNDKSWLAASALNPFKWLATVHGASIFAVVTAALLAAIPASGQSWSLAGAGQGALILWPLFGATNQLLAGFAFIVIVAWLLATGRPKWFAIPPLVIMLIVPASAMVWQAFVGNADNPSWLSQQNWLLVSVATITLALEAWLIIETALRWTGDQRPNWLGADSA